MPPLGWLALPIFVARTAAAKFKEQWKAVYMDLIPQLFWSVVASRPLQLSA
jgi:hypothetical protein